MNLDNCRYFKLRYAYAALDCTQKNCCRLITDGEELKNSSIFRRLQQCSSSFACHQGQAAMAVAGVAPPALNLRTVNSFAVLHV